MVGRVLNYFYPTVLTPSGKHETMGRCQSFYGVNGMNLARITNLQLAGPKSWIHSIVTRSLDTKQTMITRSLNDTRVSIDSIVTRMKVSATSYFVQRFPIVSLARYGGIRVLKVNRLTVSWSLSKPLDSESHARRSLDSKFTRISAYLYDRYLYHSACRAIQQNIDSMSFHPRFQASRALASHFPSLETKLFALMSIPLLLILLPVCLYLSVLVGERITDPLVGLLTLLVIP